MKQAFIFLFLLVFLSCDKAREEASVSPRVKKLSSENLTSFQAAPKFSLINLAGEMVDIESLNGKVVLLNFWATWCAPCVFEMPSMERLYQAYKDKDFEIVAINLDPPKAEKDVRQFAKLNGISFQILLDPDLKTPPEYGVGGFPESIFISREGKIMPFLDPESGEKVLRVLSDRAWDSDEYLEAVKGML